MPFITPIDAAKVLEKSTAVHDENSKMISRRECKLINNIYRPTKKPTPMLYLTVKFKHSIKVRRQGCYQCF